MIPTRRTFEASSFMDRGQEHRKRLDLEEEVARLQDILDEEQKLNAVLQCAIYGRCCHSKFVPPPVQVLLEEIAAVEEEIICLERKVEELKEQLYKEGKHANDFKHRKWHFLQGLERRVQPREFDLSQRLRSECFIWQRHAEIYPLGSASLHSTEPRVETHWNKETKPNNLLGRVVEALCEGNLENEKDIRGARKDEKLEYRRLLIEENHCETPNRLSEELVKCLISIFLKLNQAERINFGSSGAVPKLTLSCMSSKSFIPKSTIHCKTSTFHSRLDPYGLLPDLDATYVDALPYKKFVHCTRSSLDMSQLPHCLAEIEKMRFLIRRYCSFDLSLFTNKQKLAFWINTYNACILHAFLQYGLPSTPDKLLALINKATLNVGGIVLNALAIEHFILRHPCDSENLVDEKEALLRHAYGLGYPEPNVTFALCRGSWSSPALRVYTAEEVVTELERAKVEYIEASVGITCKKKIVLPKLLYWHMHDFADNDESLLEWIYSQLPRSGPLKRSIMECLNGDTKLPVGKLLEVRPYDSEFRYLLPM